jgi:hypothetical protein
MVTAQEELLSDYASRSLDMATLILQYGLSDQKLEAAKPKTKGAFVWAKRGRRETEDLAR